MKYTEDVVARFLSKVDKENSQNFYDGQRCWEWTASRSRDGYGTIGVYGKNTLAHRVSYEIFAGEIKGGLQVLHRCDNRCCVRPEHLFLGTQTDNIRDMDAKGRRGSTRGASNSHAKLTEKDVIEIRSRYGWYGVGGESSTKLAKEFGITHCQILNIANRKSWTDTE